MSTVSNASNRRRYREITGILARHGFGWLIGEARTRGPFMTGRRGDAVAADPDVQAAHMRLAFEELGATFIKIGQVLSTRADLLPPAYIAELVRLQDAVPPIPYTQISAVIEAELGASPEKLFAAFDPQPLAAASIGQVHAARLRSGQEVAVKVQRPGVAATVEHDLEILLDLVSLVDRYTTLGRDYDVPSLADEFAFTLRCELKYEREGQNADRFRRAFGADPDLHIPQIFWDYSTDRVLTMERVEGIKINDLAALAAAGIDQKRIAATSVRLLLEQLFLHGFFHADPHPGNLYVLADGRIGFIDFGMMGHLDDALQASLSHLFLAVARGDSERTLDELLSIGVARGGINRAALKRDLNHLIACYGDRSAQDLAASQIFSEVTELTRRHRLHLPSDLVLMAKVMALGEGIGLQLDPDFQFIPFARPYLERFWLQKRSPQRVGKQVAEGMVEMAEFGLTLPRRLTRLVSQMERGELGAQVEVRGTERLLAEAQKMINRLAISILVSALIVALSQFMHMIAPQGFVNQYVGQFFGLLFIVVTVLGFWLLGSLIRSGRR